MAKTVRHEDLKAYFGDKDHLEESQKKTFTQMIFEVLSEREPTEAETKLFDLILNLSIDHGEGTPSVIPTIEAAKNGKTISESLSEGVLQINDVHGGAIEPLMREIYRIENRELTVGGLVEGYIKDEKKIPGFGHRIYKNGDPRTQLIFQKLNEAGKGENYVSLLKQISEEIARQKGDEQSLPINIDGGIAAVLCSFGWEPKLGKAVFLIARTPGLLAHFLNNSSKFSSSAYE